MRSALVEDHRMSDPQTPPSDSIRAEPPRPASSERGPEASAATGELTPDDKLWGMLAHLSALVAGWFGCSFLGPLIVWLIKKDQSKFVETHAKEALNFHLNILVYILVCVAIGAVTCGFGFFVTGPLAAVIGVYSLVMSIIGGLKANNGEPYEYPMTYRMIP
jgi:uncharacterized Tic20 family protein